ncbi:DUF4405 domain-containing protein [Oricola thermophila]|uniref:DUF4405 domain-containing protein n=1 Tax=Oricola thermophila TaxID=2742145 RepID=A0A6N1VHR0_9HYPH|nr:DUF4405 domain-containing protein [Oricola thermophila]QKV19235.1 DUF4405 domain-containing protein [Oricola thermophila]
MPSFLSRYATPLITGLFVVSLVSGVALFFHLGSAYFHSMHEWLSMVLILPFVLHLWKNWRPFANYFKRPAMAVALAVSLVAGVAFALPAMTSGTTGGPGGRPEFAMVRAMQNAPISVVAPVFGQDGEGLAESLREKGFSVASTEDTLNAIAEASGKSSTEVAAVLSASMQGGAAAR